ncbi:multi antimicrobial extrusion protein MatE [Actinomadura craniellae]|uniref:Multi antimicrobial extrusion protein MatE n=1 Tax=Actinomadura craniellae TaxID=2231787 RepID=A0A365H5F5_9ACTN|nr:oligosaccharide flippase family protein [Actinomadura craniellae]RAY14321.1 multi antimicrobial extrusion protein MatE [Actinomadura craniellae]
MTETQRPGGRADLRALARGGTLSAIGAAISAITQFLVIAAVARGFTQADAGVFFAATSVFVLAAMVAKLGTQTGLVYFIARFRSLGTPELIAGCIRVALTPVMVVSLLLTGALLVSAPALAGLLAEDHAGDFTVLLRTLAVFLPLAALSDTALAATQGFRAMRPTVLIENIWRPLIQFGAVAIIAVIGFREGLAFAWAAPYLVTAVLAALWLRSLVRGLAVPRTAVPPAGEFWRFSAVRGVASIAQQALQRLDIVLVAALGGAVAAAIYTAGTRFRVVGQLGNQAISQAVQPQLAEVLAHDDRRSANALYQTATAWLVLITWPMYLLIAVFAPYVLRIFGEDYADGAPVVLIMMLTMVVASGCGMVSTVLIMAGRTTWNLANILLSLAVQVGLGLLLIPRLDLLGAALAAGAAVLANNLLPLAQIWLALRLHPFGRGTLTAMALAALSFGLLPLGVRLAFGSGLVQLVGAAVLGGAVFALGCRNRRTALRLDALRGVRRGKAAAVAT